MTTGAGLWLAIVVLGAALRLGGLDLLPLGDGEARLAVAAARLAEGTAGGSEAPLAVAATAVVFFLAGEGDAAARIAGALIGVALVAVPWLWRRELGEPGMLLASLLVAVSPTLVYDSRLLSASQGVALLALLAARTAGGVATGRGPLRASRWQGGGQRALLGVVAGLLLLAGALGWAAMLLLATVAVFSLRVAPDRLRQALVGCLDPACWLSAAATYWILGSLLTGSLAPWTGAVPGWLALWEWPERGETPLAAMALAVVYEPLVLGLALLWGFLPPQPGAVAARSRRAFFGAWAVAGSVLWLGTAGTERGVFALVLVPGLLWLAPRGVEVWQAATTLLRPALGLRSGDAIGPAAEEILGRIRLASLPYIVGAGALVILLALQTHTLFALNFAADSPELWPGSRTDRGARETLEELALDLRRPPKGIAGVAEGVAAPVAWYLREPRDRRSATLPVVAIVGGSPPSGAISYAKIGIGQRQVWQSEGFDLALAWRWLVRRAAPGPRQGLEVPIYLLAAPAA